VNNIGHDDSGAHCDCTNAYDVNVSEDKDIRFTTDISESEEAVTLMVDFYRSIRKPIYVLAYNQLKRMVKNFLNDLNL
jgi:hypothetical protein